MSVRGASRGEARAATEGGDELEDRLPEGPLHCPLARGHQGRPQQAQARQGHDKDTRCYLRCIVLEALHELGICPKASLHNVKQPPSPNHESMMVLYICDYAYKVFNKYPSRLQER